VQFVTSVDFKDAGEQETDGGIGPFPFKKEITGSEVPCS